jgi:membrane protein DedA with SNARE-associated domain
MLELFAVTNLEDLFGFIAAHGDTVYLMAFLFAFARAGFLPPLLAGYAAHHGALDPAQTFAVFWAGSWLGDELRFFVGRRWGAAIFNRMEMLHRPVQIVFGVLARYPIPFILSYRFARGMRSVAAMVVGMTDIAWARFTPLNVIGASLWAGVFTGAGYSLGHVSEKLLGQAANWATLGLLAAFILAGWLIARRIPVTR